MVITYRGGGEGSESPEISSRVAGDRCVKRRGVGGGCLLMLVLDYRKSSLYKFTLCQMSISMKKDAVLRHTPPIKDLLPHIKFVLIVLLDYLRTSFLWNVLFAENLTEQKIEILLIKPFEMSPPHFF